jgi:hypothetical protein
LFLHCKVAKSIEGQELLSKLDFGEGGNANNFYRSTFGRSARPIFDVKVYYGTGGVSGTSKDRNP